MSELTREQVEDMCEASIGLNKKWNRVNAEKLRDMALRSLAPVQEGKPVAWMCQMFADSSKTYFFATNPLLKDDAPWDVIIPLYAAAPASQGWVSVPKEPTREMLIAAGTIRNYDSESETADKDHIDWWKTMLAAAPHKEGE